MCDGRTDKRTDTPPIATSHPSTSERDKQLKRPALYPFVRCSTTTTWGPGSVDRYWCPNDCIVDKSIGYRFIPHYRTCTAVGTGFNAQNVSMREPLILHRYNACFSVVSVIGFVRMLCPPAPVYTCRATIKAGPICPTEPRSRSLGRCPFPIRHNVDRWTRAGVARCAVAWLTATYSMNAFSWNLQRYTDFILSPPPPRMPHLWRAFTHAQPARKHVLL